jgi:hypothetical protein
MERPRERKKENTLRDRIGVRRARDPEPLDQHDIEDEGNGQDEKAHPEVHVDLPQSHQGNSLQNVERPDEPRKQDHVEQRDRRIVLPLKNNMDQRRRTKRQRRRH